MKKFFLLIICLMLLAWASALHAAPTPLFSVVVSNATVTVPVVPAFNFNQALQNGSITHGALTNLTSLQVNIYANPPNTLTTNGRVLIGTWFPANTNPATETIVGSFYPLTNNLSFDVITTNSVNLSGSYGQ